jgi:hypothetical protein
MWLSRSTIERRRSEPAWVSGWLATSLAKPELALTDIDLLGEIRSAVCQSFLQSRMRDRFGTLLRLAKDVSRPGVELRDFLPMRIAQSD